jgi:ribosome biogenesis GTPase / thiamine phosphate phosphatase
LSQPPNAFRVARVERKDCLILTPDGPRTVPTRIAVAVGDWALLNAAGQVDAVLPRTTAIRRLTAGGQAIEQVLAANVDVVAVCTPLEVDARFGRVERLLALAWSSGARPVLVATKADLCTGDDFSLALNQFAAQVPGLDIVPITVTDPETLDPVRALVSGGRTLVMLGASGVGKSTLINAILGTTLATTEIRGDGKGRHTTAWRELLEVPGGGYLIDTPGLRAVGLSDAQDGVDAVFVDIGDYAAQCRFRDCEHDGEPDCEVARAIETGELDPVRLERFRKLQREVDYQARRLDARARAEHTKQWLAMVKGNRKARP